MSYDAHFKLSLFYYLCGSTIINWSIVVKDGRISGGGVGG